MGNKLDVNFVNPFIDGAIRTLKVQCSVEANPGKPFLRDPNSPMLPVDIAGIMGISSPAFQGSISLSFPEATFLKLMNRMLGEEFKAITKDVEDGAGELTNIIFGAAKTVLNQQGYAIEKALPSVVTGGNVKIRHLSPSPTLVLPFESDVGAFQIEIAMEASEHREAA